MRMFARLLLLPMVLLLQACPADQNGSEKNPPPINGKITPDRFIQYINTQSSLAAGEYVVVAATVDPVGPGESEEFTLTINYDDGTTEIKQGSWTDSKGQVSAEGNGNPRFRFNLAQAGGIKLTLESTVDNYLYLLHNEQLVAENDNAESGTTDAGLTLLKSKISSIDYANAYYAAVDPDDERTTLADWKMINGFDNGEEVAVTFRDAKDLGYGRRMFARTRDDGGFGIFVRNYVVQVTPGDATRYGPLNLVAAIGKYSQYHIGTNAIEFSPVDPSDPTSDKIARFFIFAPADANGVQHRLTVANLDGRGDKPVPTTCMSCHGGKALPLNNDGSFSEVSLKSLKMHILEAETFEYKDQDGFREADHRDGIRRINQMVHDSYVEMDSRPDGDKAKWSNTFATELVSGAYEDDFITGALQDNFIPAGWRANADRPDGIETLYQQVVKPHCIDCHSLLGTNVAEEYTSPVSFNGVNVQMSNAINFSNYEKFISYNDLIIDYVYKQSIMPSSLLNNSRFWRNPEGAPTLLATFLAGFDVFDDTGKVIPPGTPVSLPGADRTLTSPAFLDASGSHFVETFNWSIVSTPPGAVASLSRPETATTTLTADIDGDYVLKLIGSNAFGSNDGELVTISIDSTPTPAPAAQLNFVDHVSSLIKARGCAGCHSDGSSYVGMPLFLNDGNPDLYDDVLNTVDFNYPENSLLLRKLTSLQHVSSAKLDLNNVTDKSDYQLLLNWIRSGAACGVDAPGAPVIYCD